MTEKPFDEKAYDRERKAKQRAAERDLVIPIPKEINRRLDCLADPELLLQTYFDDVFWEAFTEDRREMLMAIYHAAQYGGDQAIAGSRGEGKTKIAMGGAFSLVLSMKCTFPIVIGKSQSKAQNELKTIKERLQQNKKLFEDFPEICVPFRAVGGWSSRARLQTVKGQLTNIELAADHLIFPTIAREQLPDEWPDNCEPVSCGQIFASLGIDGPIRGTNFRDRRPKLAIIDDIEDRQAAASEVLIDKNEEIIEQDIGGLAESSERVARVFLCTIQNKKCNAFRYTDPKIKPSFRGKRYRKMIKPPNRMDLVEQYLEMRKGRDVVKDPDAREAYRFWRDNKQLIEEGCLISNPQSYSKKVHLDGEPLELSAIQSYYNKVADMGAKAVATEIDNDPPDEAGPMGNGLSADTICSRISGLARRQLPANTSFLTAAIDLGKYYCHWVVIAWWEGAGGCVVDYGVAEVKGTSKDDDIAASEPIIYQALLNWRDELLSKNFVDATGTRRLVNACFVDSGTFTNAAYEFVRQCGAPFYASKGIGNYREKKNSDTVRAGKNIHAQYLPTSKVWVHDLDSDYWKQWVHERFMTPNFDENNMLRRGSLSLFQSEKSHLSYAKHITAEELVTEFKEGKGSKTYWVVNNENNHWLDATYNAAAATRLHGSIDVLSAESLVEPRTVTSEPKKRVVQHGSNIRKRPGGWMQSIRRR